MNGSSTKHCEALLRLRGAAFLSAGTRRILKGIIAEEKKRAPCDQRKHQTISGGDSTTRNEDRGTNGT